MCSLQTVISSVKYKEYLCTFCRQSAYSQCYYGFGHVQSECPSSVNAQFPSLLTSVKWSLQIQIKAVDNNRQLVKKEEVAANILFGEKYFYDQKCTKVQLKRGYFLPCFDFFPHCTFSLKADLVYLEKINFIKQFQCSFKILKEKVALQTERQDCSLQSFHNFKRIKSFQT